MKVLSSRHVIVPLLTSLTLGISATQAAADFQIPVRPGERPFPDQLVVLKRMNVAPTEIRVHDSFRRRYLEEDCLPTSGLGLAGRGPGRIISGFQHGQDPVCHEWWRHNVRSVLYFGSIQEGLFPVERNIVRATLVYTLRENYITERGPFRDTAPDGRVVDVCAGRILRATSDVRGVPEDVLPDGEDLGFVPNVGSTRGTMRLDITELYKNWYVRAIPHHGFIFRGSWEMHEPDPSDKTCLSVYENPYIEVEYH
jgi:hypothetical protein